MLRIVGINRHPEVEREFVLLQNQGGLRVNLRGHIVMAEACVNEGEPLDCLHILTEDVVIPPGAFVILYTGVGESKWTRTKDQSLAYYCHIGKEQSIWDRRPGAIHVLSIQHSYQTRQQPLTVS